VIKDSIPRLLPVILNITKDDWYKNIAESLRLVSTIITVIQPLNPGSTTPVPAHPQGTALLQTIYPVLMKRLESMDIDMEIKECSLYTLGILLHYTGSMFASSYPAIAVMLLKKLENETTRVMTLKTLYYIGKSPYRVDLSAFFTTMNPVLVSYCKQFSRNVKQYTLLVLSTFVSSSSNTLEILLSPTPNAATTGSTSNGVHLAKEISSLLSEQDLYLADLSVVVMNNVVQTFSAHNDCKSISAAAVNEGLKTIYESIEQVFYPKLLSLLTSASSAVTHTTGLILQHSIQFLQNTLHIHQQVSALSTLSIFSFDYLFQTLYKTPTTNASFSGRTGGGKTTGASNSGSGEYSRQSLLNIAKCIAGIVTTIAGFEAEKVTQILQFLIGEASKFIEVAEGTASGGDDVKTQLTLYSLGEIGEKHTNTSLLEEAKRILSRCFQQNSTTDITASGTVGGLSEEVKLAASYALGHIAVGNMTTYVPWIITSIQSLYSSPKEQYLFYIALKEIIAIHANSPGEQNNNAVLLYVDTILSVLLPSPSNPLLSPTATSSTAVDAASEDAHTNTLIVGTSHEDSVRNIISECLGIFLTLIPTSLIPTLASYVTTYKQQKIILRLLGNTIRVTFARLSLPSATVQTLGTHFPTFLQLLSDDDLEVKRNALVMVNTCIHHHGYFIQSYIASHIQPVLLSTLQIKLERVVDLGPFKHKVRYNYCCLCVFWCY
jgi:cullin-associated NEDD8-dissociated protein 1